MKRNNKEESRRDGGSPENETSDKLIDKIVRKLAKYDGDAVKAALDLAAIITDINNPDIGKAVLFFDLLQRIREFIDRHYRKSPNSPSSSKKGSLASIGYARKCPKDQKVVEKENEKEASE